MLVGVKHDGKKHDDKKMVTAERPPSKYHPMEPIVLNKLSNCEESPSVSVNFSDYPVSHPDFLSAAFRISNASTYHNQQSRALRTANAADNDNENVVSNLAVCAINPTNKDGKFMYVHFPHFMESIFACWSWWQAHPLQRPALLMPPNWQAIRNELLNRAPFIKGVVDFLIAENVLIVGDPDILNANQEMAQALPTEGLRMARPADAKSFKDRMLASLALERPVPLNHTCLSATTSPRIAILNRKRDRVLLNAVNLARALEAELRISHIPILYIEGTTFREQVKLFSSSFDILITPHGAALTNIVFMPNCGGVLEIMPFGYRFQAYFGLLAPTIGLAHGYVYIGENFANETAYWTATFQRRGIARRINQCPRVETVVEGVHLYVKKFRECCRRS